MQWNDIEDIQPKDCQWCFIYTACWAKDFSGKIDQVYGFATYHSGRDYCGPTFERDFDSENIDEVHLDDDRLIALSWIDGKEVIEKIEDD